MSADGAPRFGPKREAEDYTVARVYRGAHTMYSLYYGNLAMAYDFRVMHGEAAIEPGPVLEMRMAYRGLEEPVSLETFTVRPLTRYIRLSLDGPSRGEGRAINLFREDDRERERVYDQIATPREIEEEKWRSRHQKV